MATDNKYASVYDRMINSGAIGNQNNQVVGGFGAPDNPDGTPSVQPAQPVQKVANSVYDLYGQNKMNDYSSGIQKKKTTSPQKAALPSVGQAPRPISNDEGDIVTIDPIEEEPIDEGSDYTPPVDEGAGEGGVSYSKLGDSGFGDQAPEAPAAPNIPLMPEIPTNGGGGGGAGGGGGISIPNSDSSLGDWPPSGGGGGGYSGNYGGGGGGGFDGYMPSTGPFGPPDTSYTGGGGDFGTKSDFITDPDTGEVIIDPDTGLPATVDENGFVAIDPETFKPTGQTGFGPYDKGNFVGGYPDSPWGVDDGGYGDEEDPYADDEDQGDEEDQPAEGEDPNNWQTYMGGPKADHGTAVSVDYNKSKGYWEITFADGYKRPSII